MFTSQDVARLSGLTEGQISQLISRWGVALSQGSQRGAARKFLAVDAFKFCVAGELHRLGIDQRTVRDMLAALLPDSMDPDAEPPIFPHRQPDGPRQFLIIFPHGDGFASLVKDEEALGRAIPARKIIGAVVIDATAIAARIERAARSAT